MIPTRLFRFALLLLLPLLADASALAAQTAGAVPRIAVMGDSLACPKAPAGDIPVCGNRISVASLLNLQAYASCLVVHHRVDAELATHAYAARRDRESLRALVAGDRACLPQGGARVSAILLASALAEHLPGWRGRLHAGFAKVDQPADMIQCVVAANPRLALAVLRTSPVSDDEWKAVRMLVPNLPPCLPAGLQFETNRAALRAMLALALLDPGGTDGIGLDPAAAPALPAPDHVPVPLLFMAPPLAMTPRVTVGAPRNLNSPTANPTLPSWTVVEDFGLHHGGYDHPDLPPQLLPEDELFQFARLPDAESGNSPGALKSSLPGGTPLPPHNP